MRVKAEIIRQVVLDYALRGWAVLPLYTIINGLCTCDKAGCSSPGKHPHAMLAPHGVKDASTDPDRVTYWWTANPMANVGIATGKVSGLVVLDIDPRHGGDDSFYDLITKYGRLPDTLEVLTGGGGRHLYFKYPAGVDYLKSGAGVLGAGLDIRADGGYVVAPPSLHASGNSYMWEASSDPEHDEPADLPGWLLDLLLPGGASGNGHKPQHQAQGGKILQGQRNTWLTSEAGRMRRAGMDEPAILAALKTLNRQNCQPPLDEAEVERIAHSVCRYQPGYALTDAGNAEFLNDRCTGQICYRHDVRRWFVFRSPVWVADENGEVERLALEAIRERQAQAFSIQDADLRKKTLTFLLNSENGYRLRSMLEIAKSRPTLAKSGKEFNQQPMLLAVKNGVIDLETGKFREGRPEDYLTQCAGTHYDPQAEAPRWLQFLEEIFLGDKDLIAFIQRAIGYTLTGLTREQVFFFCHGTGRNGKSTLFEALRALLGEYARHAAFSTFTKDHAGGGHSDDLMALEGARLVTAAESKTVSTLAEDTLKMIAGSDPLTGSRKFEHTRTFVPTFKLWLAANNRPKVRDVTIGFWRKVILIPFEANLEGRADPTMPEKLRAELPGILTWALAGCLEYQKQGLNPPKKCKEATANWRSDNDPLADFLETVKVGDGLEVQVSALYQEYERFCTMNKQKPVSQQAFSPLVEAHGFKREKRRNGRYFIGVGL